MSLIHNERTKLTATWLNAMASGVVITGVIPPFIAVTFQITTSVSAGLLVASSLICILIGISLHWFARQILGRLRP